MARKRTQGLSARDFKNPLLIVLHEMSHGVPGRTVYFKDTYKAVCDRMGITEDQYGNQPSTGKLWVHQWIGFAFKALKKPDVGLCEAGRKGRWTLTEKGQAEAQRLADNGETFTVEAPVQTEPDLVQIQAKVIENANPGGVSLVLAGVDPADDYHADPYIRSLAIQQTRCFGNYSAKSRTCGKCPLAGRCQAKMAMDLSVLAALWRENANKPVEEPKVEEPKVEAKESGKPDLSNLPKDADIVVAALPSVCVHCGGEIAKGEQAIWIPSTGTFHTTCPLPE